MVNHARQVAYREDLGVGDRLQRILHLDETPCVDLETGLGRPGRRARSSNPKNFVNLEPGAVLGSQVSAIGLDHRGTGMHTHAALGQGRAKCPGDGRIVARENFRLYR